MEPTNTTRSLFGPYEREETRGAVRYHVTRERPAVAKPETDARRYVFAAQHLASYERQVKMALSHEFRLSAESWNRMMHLSCQVYRAFRRNDGEPMVLEAARVGREWVGHGFTAYEVEVAVIRSLEVLGRELDPSEMDLVHDSLVS